MSISKQDFADWASGARHELVHEREQLKERDNQIEKYLYAIEVADNLISENENLKEENEKLKEELEAAQQQLSEEKKQRSELEMKMNEMSKLSAGMAKKASQDDLSKALRGYLNISKRKTQSKREAAKTVFMEMLISAKLDLPDDIMNLLEHLDDEQEDKTTELHNHFEAGSSAQVFNDKVEGKITWE